MKCLNCGTTLTKDAKFCPCCGTKVEIYTTSEQSKKTLQEKIKVFVVKSWNKLSLYGKVSTISIAFFTFFFLVALLAEKNLASFFAMFSLVLVIFALLLKKEVIKTSKKWLHIIALSLSFILIIPYFATLTAKDRSDFDWTELLSQSSSDNNHEDKKNTEELFSNNDSVSDDITSDNYLEETTSNDTDKQDSTEEYKIDYTDAKSFEEALNNGVKVKGKTVQFDVVEYKPDSILGINCWSGEHLNFISEKELNVVKGDYVVGRITEEPTKTLGSWEILYEVLSVNKSDEQQDTPHLRMRKFRPPPTRRKLF